MVDKRILGIQNLATGFNPVTTDTFKKKLDLLQAQDRSMRCQDDYNIG